MAKAGTVIKFDTELFRNLLCSMPARFQAVRQAEDGHAPNIKKWFTVQFFTLFRMAYSDFRLPLPICL